MYSVGIFFCHRANTPKVIWEILNAKPFFFTESCSKLIKGFIAGWVSYEDVADTRLKSSHIHFYFIDTHFHYSLTYSNVGQSVNPPLCCRLKYLIYSRWIAMTFTTCIHGHQRMNPTELPFTLCHHFNLSRTLDYGRVTILSNPQTPKPAHLPIPQVH